ncbi:hypothetical protein BDW22DRAFT_1351995 [Trametopsis cervina]|nr:hypothetical protein BDW22DRAFT_1351995 [Trametopsis cervina]
MYVVLGSIMVNTLELIFWMAGTFAIVIGLRRTHMAIARGNNTTALYLVGTAGENLVIL